jgi:hypothetical protein
VAAASAASRRAIGFGEPPCDLNFERGAGAMRHGRDPSENVTRQQAHSEPVRVVKNSRVVDSQVKCCARRHTCSHRTWNV